MKVISLDGDQGTVEISNVRRTVSFKLLDEVKEGDYVLIHAGFAIQKLREEDAKDTLKLLEDLDLSSAL